MVLSHTLGHLGTRDVIYVTNFWTYLLGMTYFQGLQPGPKIVLEY